MDIVAQFYVNDTLNIARRLINSVKKGRWYHIHREYLIHVDDKIQVLSLNIFDRIFMAFYKGDYFSMKLKNNVSLINSLNDVKKVKIDLDDISFKHKIDWSLISPEVDRSELEVIIDQIEAAKKKNLYGLVFICDYRKFDNLKRHYFMPLVEQNCIYEPGLARAETGIQVTFPKGQDYVMVSLNFIND